jgi:hypothetical protein
LLRATLSRNASLSIPSSASPRSSQRHKRRRLPALAICNRTCWTHPPVGRQTLSDFRRLDLFEALEHSGDVFTEISRPILLRPQTTHSRPPPVL